MTTGATIREADAAAASFSLSSQQLAYFQTFGFIKLPGLFASDVARLTEGFDEAFATRPPDKIITKDQLQETDNPTFTEHKRTILFHIIEKSDAMRWLATDPRILNIVTSIVGERYEARPTDGHVFDCDTAWHPDMGSDDRFRLKLSFYLDSQRANSGAIRVIPGSHFHDGPYAQTLLARLYGSNQKVRDNFGVDAKDIPCWTIETDPGDLVCWNFRTFHATFHGFNRRRLFSMTYAAAE